MSNDNNQQQQPSTPPLPQETPVDKKRERVLVVVTDPVEKRIELMRGDFVVPDTAKRAKRAVWDATEDCTRLLYALYRAHAPNVDTGRFIAAIDSIKHARDVAGDAFTLPWVTKEVDAPVSDEPAK